MSCPTCGGRVVQRQGAGRPRTYCSVPCRRAAEAKRRRLEARVAFLDRRLVMRREQAAAKAHFAGHQRAIEALEDELAIAEAALLDLYRREEADA